jgi:hypothetical protein
MDAETQLAGFFAAYEPAVAELGRALRARLRARLPGLFEIVYVYERQGALVISYSPSERGYEGLCSLALYPDRAHLHFAQGARLSKSDPKGLLEGRGGTVRHVVLRSVAEFDRPEIEALIAAAVALAKLRLDATARGSVILRTEAQKRRARRARTAAPPAAARPVAKAGPRDGSSTRAGSSAARGRRGRT